MAFPPDSPADHAGCAEFLRSGAATVGLDLTVSELPPIIAGPYTTEPFICPHGVALWVEPTGEQIAEYATWPRS